MRFSPFLLLLLTIPLGCSDDVAPTPITTDFSPTEIGLYTQLQSNGVLAQISLTANTPEGAAQLGAGDVLLFRVPGGPSQTLAAYGSAFWGQLETDSTSFELVFSRGSSSFVLPIQIPPAFVLAGPANVVPRSSGIPLSWGPPGENFETWIDIEGPCLNWSVSRYFSATATNYDIQPADLSIQPNTTDCELRAWVTRSATAPPAATAGGPTAIAGAFNVRSVSIPTTP